MTTPDPWLCSWRIWTPRTGRTFPITKENHEDSKGRRGHYRPSFQRCHRREVRPALVVQSDARNALLAETIVALITKNLKHLGSDSTHLLIDIGTPAGQKSGLMADSAVKCGKLFTIPQNMIRQKIGFLSATLLLQVNVGLKAALELP